jgi:hypothetical protein
LFSSVSSISTSSVQDDEHLSSYAQPAVFLDELPDSVAHLGINAEPLAKLLVKLRDVQRQYYYFKGHVFTLW